MIENDTNITWYARLRASYHQEHVMGGFRFSLGVLMVGFGLYNASEHGMTEHAAYLFGLGSLFIAFSFARTTAPRHGRLMRRR
jgi:hypothetical protein